MNLKDKIKKLYKISKQTNILIYIIQYISYKLFKKTIFNKIKINKLIYNITSLDDMLHLNEYFGNYYDIDNIKNLNICIDIGANSGDFSIMLSKRCKHIYSLEPITEVYTKFLKNISDNHFKNITTFNVGISSNCGFAKLNIPKNHTGGAKISNDGDYEIKIISWKKLYELIGKPKGIDLLKIDCEGCEYSLLDDPYILEYVKEIRMELHILNELDKIKANKLIKLFYKNGFIYTNMTLKQSKKIISNKITTEHFFINHRI